MVWEAVSGDPFVLYPSPSDRTWAFQQLTLSRFPVQPRGSILSQLMPAQCEGSVNTNSLHSFFFKKVYVFILAVLGLCCCIWAFPSCGQWLGGTLGCGVRASRCGSPTLAVEHML